MKMLIKFLSDEPILNVLSPVYLKPEETVFIGKQGAEYEREAARLGVLLRALGAPGSVRYIPVDVYDTERLIRELETLHMACHDCLVDVSGSNNAVIFAVRSGRGVLPKHQRRAAAGSRAPEGMLYRR